MTTKETYVVTLPLSSDQENNLILWAAKMDSGQANIIDIFKVVGTRVESSAPVVGYANNADISGKYFTSDNFCILEMRATEQPDYSIALIRQSGHLAAMAEKDAEIDALCSGIDEIDLAIDCLSEEDSDGRSESGSEMKRQCLEIVETIKKTLKGTAS